MDWAAFDARLRELQKLADKLVSRDSSSTSAPTQIDAATSPPPTTVPSPQSPSNSPTTMPPPSITTTSPPPLQIVASEQASSATAVASRIPPPIAKSTAPVRASLTPPPTTSPPPTTTAPSTTAPLSRSAVPALVPPAPATCSMKCPADLPVVQKATDPLGVVTLAHTALMTSPPSTSQGYSNSQWLQVSLLAGAPLSARVPPRPPDRRGAVQDHIVPLHPLRLSSTRSKEFRCSSLLPVPTRPLDVDTSLVRSAAPEPLHGTVIAKMPMDLVSQPRAMSHTSSQGSLYNSLGNQLTSVHSKQWDPGIENTYCRGTQLYTFRLASAWDLATVPGSALFARYLIDLLGTIPDQPCARTTTNVQCPTSITSSLKLQHGDVSPIPKSIVLTPRLLYGSKHFPYSIKLQHGDNRQYEISFLQFLQCYDLSAPMQMSMDNSHVLNGKLQKLIPCPLGHIHLEWVQNSLQLFSPGLDYCGLWSDTQVSGSLISVIMQSLHMVKSNLPSWRRRGFHQYKITGVITIFSKLLPDKQREEHPMQNSLFHFAMLYTFDSFTWEIAWPLRFSGQVIDEGYDGYYILAIHYWDTLSPRDCTASTATYYEIAEQFKASKQGCGLASVKTLPSCFFHHSGAHSFLCSLVLTRMVLSDFAEYFSSGSDWTLFSPSRIQLCSHFPLEQPMNTQGDL